MFVSWFSHSVIWKNGLKFYIFALKYMFYEHTILNKASTFEVALCYTTSRLKMIINSEKDTKLYIHTTLFLGQALLEPPRITPEVDLYRFLTRRAPSGSSAQKNETKYTTNHGDASVLILRDDRYGSPFVMPRPRHRKIYSIIFIMQRSLNIINK